MNLKGVLINASLAWIAALYYLTAFTGRNLLQVAYSFGEVSWLIARVMDSYTTWSSLGLYLSTVSSLRLLLLLLHQLPLLLVAHAHWILGFNRLYRGLLFA